MREAVIILPVSYNDGKPMAAVHAWLRNKLCHVFGGFTAHEAVGGWKDPNGRVVIEPVIRYVVGVEYDFDNDTLVNIARDCRRMGNQDAVYVRSACGEVVLVDSNAPVAA
jgi:hypothetical protein